MLIHTLEEVTGTARDAHWGNGTSRRLLIESDGLGFTLTETDVLPGTKTVLRYDNHMEACYCISGEGRVLVGEDEYVIVPGVMYAPGRGEEHTLIADTHLRLVCVFNPPLRGDETHDPSNGQPSGY